MNAVTHWIYDCDELLNSIPWNRPDGGKIELHHGREGLFRHERGNFCQYGRPMSSLSSPVDKPHLLRVSPSQRAHRPDCVCRIVKMCVVQYQEIRVAQHVYVDLGVSDSLAVAFLDCRQ
jgi:hypothetical protein